MSECVCGITVHLVNHLRRKILNLESGIRNQESGMTHSFKVFLGRYQNIGIRGDNIFIKKGGIHL